MSAAVLEERIDQSIVLLTLNQPERRNPMSDPVVVEALTAALTRAEADMETRVIVLTGAGSVFSSGGDLNTMAAGGGLVHENGVETRLAYRRGVQRLPLTFETLETPVIAAVNGAAIGGGCDLACMCDIRIAAESAFFAESFVQLGLTPGDGGAWLLQRAVGYSKACEMAFTGSRVSAAEALACGLVSQVVPDAALRDAALALANRIAANPPHAVRMTKRMMRAARDASLEASLTLAAAMNALAHQTDEHRAALAAFAKPKA
jgi:enoyl-CoA hydratase/carnithine racemase